MEGKRYDVNVTVRVSLDARDPQDAREGAMAVMRHVLAAAIDEELPNMGAITRLGPVGIARKRRGAAV